MLVKDSNPELKQQSYDSQIIVGPTPRLETDEKDGKHYDSLLKKAKRTFRDKEEWPFVAVTEFKLNNLFIVGGGGRFHEAVIKAIHNTIKRITSEITIPSNLEFILVESFAYYELVLVMFGDCLDEFMAVAEKLREMQFREIYSFLDNPSDFAKMTLAYQLNPRKGLADEMDWMSQRHIFETSVSTYGFHLDLLSADDSKVKPCTTKSSKVQFASNLFVRSGHFESIWKILEKNKGYITESFTTIGRADLVIRFESWDEFIGFHRKVISDAKEKSGDPQHDFFMHIQEAHSQILSQKSFDTAEAGAKISTSSQVIRAFSNDLKKFEIPMSLIARLKGKLSALDMPKVLSERILSLYSSFNVAICDRLLFIYFIELRNFLAHLMVDTIDYWHKLIEQELFDREHVEKLLTEYADILDQAFSDRYYQSYWTRDYVDHNSKMRGGVQCVLSTWDMVYKILSRPLGEANRSNSILYITSRSGVFSSQNALLINYSHIFLPSIFLSVAAHEAANHYYTKRLNASKAQTKLEDAKIDKGYSAKDFEVLRRMSQAGLQHELFDHEQIVVNDRGAPLELLHFEEGHLERSESDTHKFYGEKFKNVSTKPFVRHMKSEMFRYFTVDLITFYYAYAGNFELFWNWHFASGLIQASNSFSSLKKIGPHFLITMLMRMAFIAIIAKVENFREQFRPSPFQRIDSGWDNFFDPIVDFAESMMDSPLFEKWILFFQAEALLVGIRAFDINESMTENILLHSDEVEKHRAEVKKLLAQYEPLAKKIQMEGVNNLENPSFRDKICSGSIIKYRNFSSSPINVVRKEATLHVTKVIYSYLSLLGEVAFEKDKNYLLYRHPDWGRPVVDKEKDSKMMFDPLGGTFVHDRDVRRQIFKWQTALLKALWNVGNIEKLNLFREFLKP